MTSFRTNWEQYRSAVADYRGITEDPDDTTALDRQVTHATRLFNITDQGITNKLTKLIKDEIEGEKQSKDIKPTLPAIPKSLLWTRALKRPYRKHQQARQPIRTHPNHQSKNKQICHQLNQAIDDQIGLLRQPDTLAAQALAALLKQITGQFNDIIALYELVEQLLMDHSTSETLNSIRINNVFTLRKKERKKWQSR